MSLSSYILLIVKKDISKEVEVETGGSGSGCPERVDEETCGEAAIEYNDVYRVELK